MRAIFVYLQASNEANQQHANTMTSTRLYDQACIAQNIAQKRLQAARLSVPDELHWYNNHTNWDALNRKEFREIMIRMETITVQHYDDFGDCTYPSRHVAIKAFWAEEWGCEYVPESGKWLNLATGSVIKSETEKKAERDAKKALKKALKEASTKASTKNQYNDEEEEMYVQAAQKQQAQSEKAQKAQKSLEDQVKLFNQQQHRQLCD